jgi:hypothetical protein
MTAVYRAPGKARFRPRGRLAEAEPDQLQVLLALLHVSPNAQSRESLQAVRLQLSFLLKHFFNFVLHASPTGQSLPVLHAVSFVHGRNSAHLFVARLHCSANEQLSSMSQGFPIQSL